MRRKFKSKEIIPYNYEKLNSLPVIPSEPSGYTRIYTARFHIKIPAFYSKHNICMACMILPRTAIILLHNIHQLLDVMQAHCVLCEVQTASYM